MIARMPATPTEINAPAAFPATAAAAPVAPRVANCASIFSLVRCATVAITASDGPAPVSAALLT
ncbi:hypothetical protein D3C84_1101050 [compost metagenome]